VDFEAILKAVATQGIGVMAAVAMFVVYRNDVHKALNSWQGQTKILTDLVRDITCVLQRNTDVIADLKDELRRQ
jgi:hypothetical protein